MYWNKKSEIFCRKIIVTKSADQQDVKYTTMDIITCAHDDKNVSVRVESHVASVSTT